MESAVYCSPPPNIYSNVQEVKFGCIQKIHRKLLIVFVYYQPNSCTKPAEWGLEEPFSAEKKAGGTFLGPFLMVVVAVAAEPLPLPLHIFFHFPILMVGGSGAGLSTDSYDSSGIFSAPVSHWLPVE